MYLDQDSELHINQLTAFRRDLHRHPELKYQESRTADKIAAFLEALGITPVRGLGQTGLVASIHGQGRGHGPHRLSQLAVSRGSGTSQC